MSCQRSSSSRARLREDRDGAASRPRRSGSIVPRSPSLSLPIRTWRWLSSMARCDRRMAVGARDPRRRQARRRRRCRCRSLHPHRASQADLTAAGWPATGRVVRLALMPMSARAGELHRRRRTVAANVRRPDGECAPRTSSGRHRRLRRACPAGRLPGATVAASEAGRQRWLAGYVDQLVARDVPLAGGRRDPVRLRRYLRSIAANLAGEVELKSLIDATNLDRSTALAYDDVLEHLLITERLPAWSTNRLATNASPSRRSRRSGAADRSPSRPPRQ